MAVCFAWSFGQETAVQLQQLGWAFSSTVATEVAPDNAYQWKAASGLANYSLKLNGGDWAQPPSVFHPTAAQGSVQLAVRSTSGSSMGSYPWLILAYGGGSYSALKTTAAGGVELYVAGIYKATSASTFGFTTGFVVCTLFYDYTANPWRCRAQIDAEAIAEETQARAAASVGSVLLKAHGARTALDLWVGSFVIRDTYAESAPHDRYVTRIGVDADVSTVGTWAQTGAATNHGCVGNDPFDDAKHLEEAAPSVGDNVVCSYTSALGTKLGFSPSAIDAVAVYAFSEGAGLGCAASLGDGSATSTGSTESIGSSTTPAGVVAETKPSGGAWSGSDTPRPGFKVVTT